MRSLPISTLAAVTLVLAFGCSKDATENCTSNCDVDGGGGTSPGGDGGPSNEDGGGPTGVDGGSVTCDPACVTGQFCDPVTTTCLAVQPPDAGPGVDGGLVGDACGTVLDILLNDNFAAFDVNTSGLVDDFHGSCAPTGGKDAVYRLTLAEPSRVTVSSVAAAGVDSAVFFQSTCGGAEVAGACKDVAGNGESELMTVTELAAGAHYLVVDSASAQTAGSQNVRVSVTPTTAVVAGAVCDAPVMLFASGSDTATHRGDTVNAGHDHASVCQPETGEGKGGDIVYEFTTTATRSFKATVLPDAIDTGIVPTMFLRTQAVCNTGGVSPPYPEPRPGDVGVTAWPVCVNAPNPGGTAELIVSALPPGRYQLTVATAATSQNLPEVNGPFTLNASLGAVEATAPSNTTCATARELTLTNGHVQLTGSTRLGGNNTQESCADGTQTSPEVVYSFVTPAGAPSNARAVIASLNTNELIPAAYIRTACSNPTLAGCSASVGKPSFDTVVYGYALAPSTRYFLTVDGTSPTGGPFSLELDVATAPSNDACSAARPIQRGQRLSGSNLAATGQFSTGSCSAPGVETFYSFTPLQSGPATVTVHPQRGYDPKIVVINGCSASSCVASADAMGASESESVTFTAIPGTTYFIGVDSSVQDGVGRTEQSGRGNYEITVK